MREPQQTQPLARKDLSVIANQMNLASQRIMAAISQLEENPSQEPLYVFSVPSFYKAQTYLQSFLREIDAACMSAAAGRPQTATSRKTRGMANEEAPPAKPTRRVTPRKPSPKEIAEEEAKRIHKEFTERQAAQKGKGDKEPKKKRG